MSFLDQSTLQKAGLAGAAAAGVLTLLAIKYPNRAIFDELPEGVQVAPAVPLLGSFPLFLSNRDRLHEFIVDNFEKLDTMTMVSSSLGMGRRINTINPDNVEYFLKTNFENYAKGPQFSQAVGDFFGHGIFNANGDVWRYQRKAASLIFNVKNFRDHFTDVFVKELHYACKAIFDTAAETRKPVDFHDIMYKFTLESFVLLGFGVELNSLKHEEKQPFATSFDIAQARCSFRIAFPFWKITESIAPLLTPWKMHMKDHIKVVDEFAFDVIERRKKQLAEGLEFKDLLSRFMTARDEHGELLDKHKLRDVVLNFIIAGRDTTAQVLSWGFYSLTLHPRVEEKLFKEISESVTDELEHDSPALYEVIKGLTYAHAFLYEVLRLYPSVPGNMKYALNDDVWPDGTRISKGDTVTWSSYAMGRSTKIWGPDAKEFKPERWITPDGELRRETQGRWPAFHVGPRVCLGQNLAILEALAAVCVLIRRYKFTLAPNQQITYLPSLTHPMKNGMQVFVEKR